MTDNTTTTTENPETTIQAISLGQFLRQERERTSMTLEQVASSTKINLKLLQSLESDNYEALPAKPFVRGFVTSYSKAIGLEPREILTRFDSYLDQKSGSKFKRETSAPHIFVEKDSSSDNSKTTLTVTMVGFVIIAAIAYAVVKPQLKHQRRHKKEAEITNSEVITVVPPPSDSQPIIAKAEQKVEASKVESKTEAKVENKVEAKADVKTEAKPQVKAEVKSETKSEVKAEAKKDATTTEKPLAAGTPLPSNKIPPIPNAEVKQKMIIKAAEDCWVRYQADDRPIQAFTLKKDKVIFVRARESIRFTSAKPAALLSSTDNINFQPFTKTYGDLKQLILPSSAQDKFKDNLWLPVNSAYLSTGTN